MSSLRARIGKLGECLLRRSEKIVLRDEVEPEPATAPAPEVERRSAGFDRRSQEADRNVAPIVERRQTDRRQGIEALRAEALKSVMSRVEDRNFNGIKSRMSLRPGGKMPRLLLLAVALVAGVMAAFLALQRDPSAAPTVEAAAPEIVREARARILVARDAIGVGQRLTPDLIGWEEWPEGAMRAEYVSAAASPDALAELTGAVARFEFFPGEPIREQKLAIGGEGGYLSAVLDSGMRGVSVAVTASSASGGFIVPNDRVDLVLTRSTEVGAPSSETVLRNVRVLAINSQLGETSESQDEAKPLTFTGDAIATLELDAKQSEVVASAVTMGRLSLVLRSMIDPAGTETSENHSANQLIRMTSPFWNR
jgi:pilus assembly protein CpaB